MDSKNLKMIDQRHIIHPYASPSNTGDNLIVTKTTGCLLVLEDGNQLVDGMSSWWSAIHGYNHPLITQAANRQISQMPHVMFGGLTHAPAIELAEKLLSLTPPTMDKVFFADSGSVAMEVAIKVALQYWQARKQERHQLLTVRRGYHGDTFGVMSISDPDTGMHQNFKGFLAEQIFAPEPILSDAEAVIADADDIHELERLLQENHRKIAAVTIEPMVQGAGGMRFYRAEYLRRLRRLCDAYDVLLIFDEIATGFGRTAKMFASEHADFSTSEPMCPDILCVGKALTGGFMTLSACMMSSKVADEIAQSSPGVIMHGPTFMANPLACAVANASIDLLVSTEYDWLSKVKGIEKQLKHELEPLTALPIVKDVRVFGAIGVVEIKCSIEQSHINPILLSKGVWLRPFGNLLYTMPPFVISTQQLSAVTSTIEAICRLMSDENQS